MITGFIGPEHLFVICIATGRSVRMWLKYRQIPGILGYHLFSPSPSGWR